jgi:hypothetical protein
MLAASLAFTGGTVLLTAGPAAALPPGLTCTSGSGSFDISAPIPIATFDLVGCGTRDAVLTAVADITGGVQPASIAWSTGKAASVGTAQIANLNIGGDTTCPSTIGADLIITITGGVYSETQPTGTSHICADPTNLPVIALTASPVNL